MPVSQQPVVELHSPEAQAEMLRVVRGLFPDRSEWPELMLEILRKATLEERNRFCGDDRGMDYEMTVWATQKAEVADPVQAARWRRFKAAIPSRLNIRPLPVLEMSRLPPDALSPGIRPPRLP
ncbi:hypothetical protein D1007_30366 [Hordeum vulgare]|nr:hypothetical protein D1007_30366 [Hordeum vulgare]